MYEYEISKNKQNFVGLKILDFLWDFWAMAVTDMHPRHKLHSKSNIEKLLLLSSVLGMYPEPYSGFGSDIVEKWV